jgi:hypothetical protein
VRLPHAKALAAVEERLRAANVDRERRDDGVFVRDPAGNGILFVVA